jgi:hypothetical protein
LIIWAALLVCCDSDSLSQEALIVFVLLVDPRPERSSSLLTSAKTQLRLVRNRRWSIQNPWHWVRDAALQDVFYHLSQNYFICQKMSYF